MHSIKSIILLFLLTSASTSIFSQVSFAIACNQSTNQLEIVVEGRAQPNQQILKGGFPNQAAAETYKSNNASSLSCGNVNRTTPNQRSNNNPPPRAATTFSSAPTVQSNTNTNSYNKKAILFAAVTYAQNIPTLYNATGSQQAGYNIGLRTFFGDNFKWGLGVQYASILGAFEPVVLDNFSGDEGASNAIRTELLGLYPISIGNGNWLHFTFSGAYYLNHKTNLGRDNIELSPQPISQFYAGALELGVDIKGLNVGVGVEYTGDILEFHTSGMYLLRFSTGISF